jgi:hypothetical protein
LKPSRLRGALLALACASFTGCVATLEHTPDIANVCSTADARGWSGSGSSWELARDGKPYWNFGLIDDGSRHSADGPLRDVYWVMFSAGTFGSGAGVPRLPMVYDPAGAVLLIDGRQVHALPRLWTAEQRAGRYVPTRELAVPALLNAPDIAFPEWFFLAFPAKPPRASDTWRIDGGSILLDGQRVPLPVGQSCFTPSRTWMSPII